jgi:predicted RNase H-like HicB family nuclease
MTNQILKENLKFTINIEVVIVKEDDYYIAYSPALELSAYGDSIEKARQSFTEEVGIFIEETRKRGTLEKYLLKNGWRLQLLPKPIYEPPRQNLDQLSGLMKSKGRMIRQDIQFPVC